MENHKDLLRKAVKTFYTYQKLRIALGNRLLSNGLEEDTVFGEHEKRFKRLEQEMLEYIEKLCEKYLITKKLLEIKGIGITMAAVIISEIDIYKADTVSKIWRYCGLGVVNGKAERPVKGEKLHYNKFLKSKLLGVLAKSFLINNNHYRKFYDDYKHRLESKNWGASKLHRHRAALRYMMKMFLIDLYKMWREIEELPVREPYKEEYIKQHAIA